MIVQNICVYCGSGSGQNPLYIETARALGRAIAEEGCSLVYGGGGRGLMGALGRTVLAQGGHVTSLIPDFLVRMEAALDGVSELVLTETMHERKQLMYERSDAFVALPGGVGTLEEIVEQLTWSQLGQHDKPIVLCNAGAYWQPLMDLIGEMRAETFIRPDLDITLTVVDSAQEVMPAIKSIAARKAVPAGAQLLPDKF